MKRIDVYNTAGVLVKRVFVNNANTVTVNTVGLSKGMYLVRLVGEKEVEQLKMIKE